MCTKKFFNRRVVNKILVVLTLLLVVALVCSFYSTRNSVFADGTKEYTIDLDALDFEDLENFVFKKTSLQELDQDKSLVDQIIGSIEEMAGKIEKQTSGDVEINKITLVNKEYERVKQTPTNIEFEKIEGEWGKNSQGSIFNNGGEFAIRFTFSIKKGCSYSKVQLKNSSKVQLKNSKLKNIDVKKDLLNETEFGSVFVEKVKIGDYFQLTLNNKIIDNLSDTEVQFFEDAKLVGSKLDEDKLKTDFPKIWEKVKNHTGSFRYTAKRDGQSVEEIRNVGEYVLSLVEPSSRGEWQLYLDTTKLPEAKIKVIPQIVDLRLNKNNPEDLKGQDYTHDNIGGYIVPNYTIKKAIYRESSKDWFYEDKEGIDLLAVDFVWHFDEVAKNANKIADSYLCAAGVVGIKDAGKYLLELKIKSANQNYKIKIDNTLVGGVYKSDGNYLEEITDIVYLEGEEKIYVVYEIYKIDIPVFDLNNNHVVDFKNESIAIDVEGNKSIKDLFASNSIDCEYIYEYTENGKPQTIVVKIKDGKLEGTHPKLAGVYDVKLEITDKNYKVDQPAAKKDGGKLTINKVDFNVKCSNVSDKGDVNLFYSGGLTDNDVEVSVDGLEFTEPEKALSGLQKGERVILVKLIDNKLVGSLNGAEKAFKLTIKVPKVQNMKFHEFLIGKLKNKIMKAEGDFGYKDVDPTSTVFFGLAIFGIVVLIVIIKSIVVISKAKNPKKVVLSSDEKKIEKKREKFLSYDIYYQEQIREKYKAKGQNPEWLD